jgi:hypothetical protein
MPHGYDPLPSDVVASTLPLLAWSLETVCALKFVTQIFAPSKAIPYGPTPTECGPLATLPSAARSLETVLLP